MLCVFIYKRDLCFVKYLYDFKAEIGASNQATSSMPTVHCALFEVAAAGITKRLRGSSLKIDKKRESILSNTCKNSGGFL